MEHTQKVLFELQLPPVLQTLKNSCVNFIVPTISSLVQSLQSESSDYLSIFVFVVGLLGVWMLWPRRQSSKQQKNKAEHDAELTKELKQFRNELKSINNTVKQLTAHCNSAEESESTPTVQEQLVNKLMKSYQDTANENYQFAHYVIDAQEEILQQLKLIKKTKAFSERTPSSGSFDDHLPNADKNTLRYGKEELYSNTTAKSDNQDFKPLMGPKKSAQLKRPLKVVPPPVRR